MVIQPQFKLIANMDNIVIGIEIACLDPSWNYFECLQWLSSNNFEEVELFCAPRRGALYCVSPWDVDTTVLKREIQGFKKVDIRAPYHHDWDISLVSVNPKIREAYFTDMEDVARMGTELGGEEFCYKGVKIFVPKAQGAEEIILASSPGDPPTKK